MAEDRDAHLVAEVALDELPGEALAGSAEPCGHLIAARNYLARRAPRGARPLADTTMENRLRNDSRSRIFATTRAAS